MVVGRMKCKRVSYSGGGGHVIFASAGTGTHLHTPEQWLPLLVVTYNIERHFPSTWLYFSIDLPARKQQRASEPRAVCWLRSRAARELERCHHC